jgi:cell wall-associated NlpC family hydrolase
MQFTSTAQRSPRNDLLAIVLWSLLLAPGLQAAHLLAADESPTQQQITELVKQLGNDSYRIREQAQRKLLKIGLLARKALVSGLKNPDLEIRLRARRLLAQVVEEEFEGRLAAFIADVNGTKDHDLPGWKRYRDSVGNTRMARSLFVAMIREEMALLQAFETGTQLETTFSNRVRALQPYSSINSNGPRVASSSSLATMLFLSGQPELTLDQITHQQIFSLLRYTGTQNVVKGSPYSGLLFDMLGGWIQKLDKEQPTAYYPLMIALHYDMKDVGFEIAKKRLGNTTSSSAQQYAIMAIARFGTARDIDLLIPQLQNSAVCHTWSNPQIKKGVIKTQVRDVALVMMLEMTKQNHQQYGFTLLQRNPTTVFHGYTCGYVDESQRDKALQMWNTWYSKHLEQRKSP